MKRILLILMLLFSISYGNTSSSNIFDKIENIKKLNNFIQKREDYLKSIASSDFKTDEEYKSLLSDRDKVLSNILDILKSKELYANKTYEEGKDKEGLLSNISLNRKQGNDLAYIYRDAFALADVELDNTIKNTIASIKQLLGTMNDKYCESTLSQVNKDLYDLSFLSSLKKVKEYDYQKITEFVEENKDKKSSMYTDVVEKYSLFQENLEASKFVFSYLSENLDTLLAKDVVVKAIQKSGLEEKINAYFISKGIDFEIKLFSIFGDDKTVLNHLKLSVIVLIIFSFLILALVLFKILTKLSDKYIFVSKDEDEETVRVIDEINGINISEDEEPKISKERIDRFHEVNTRKVNKMKKEFISNLISSIKKPLVLLLLSFAVHLSFVYLYFPNPITVDSKTGFTLSNVLYFMNITLGLWAILKANSSYKGLGIDYIDFIADRKALYRKLKIEKKFDFYELREENLEFYSFIIKTFFILVYIGLFISIFAPEILKTAAAFGIGIAILVRENLSSLKDTYLMIRSNMLRIGDWIYINGIHGTLMKIGLYQSQIRGFDQSVITVSNIEFFKGSFTNYGHRGVRRIMFDFYIKKTDSIDDFRYPTNEKIIKIIDDVRKMLLEHEGISKNIKLSNRDKRLLGITDTKFVHFVGMDKGLKINVYSFSNIDDWGKTRDIEQDVLLNCKKIVEENNCLLGDIRCELAV